MKLKLLIPFLLGLCSCSAMDRWMTDHPPRRVFSVSADWVHQGPQHTNNGFRKINRFAPVLFHHPQKGDVVIQANAIDGIAAYERESGHLVWRRQILNGVESTATLEKDRLYFGGLDGFFYCISAVDGSVIWNFPTRIENLAEPLLVEGLVIFLSGANTLYALDANTGKQTWIYNRQDTQALSIRGGSRPAYRSGTVYAGFSDGALVALTAKTGQVKWEKVLNRNKRFRDLDSNPVIDGEFLYVAGFDDHLYSLRTATGDIVWRAERGGYGTPLLDKDHIYFATTSDTFDCLDRTTGQKIWSYKLSEGIATSAQIYKGLLVFGESQGSLKFLELGSGKPVAQFDPGRGILSPPTVDEKLNRVFFISGEANVYSIRAGWAQAPAFDFLK